MQLKKNLRMLWTFIAAWFCYNSPFFPSEESIRRAKGPDEVANLDVSRSVLQRVAQGFADFIVENSRREDRTVGCNGESGWHLWVEFSRESLATLDLPGRALRTSVTGHTFLAPKDFRASISRDASGAALPLPSI